MVNLYLSFFALDLLVLKEENQNPNEMEQTDQYEKHHDLITGEKATHTKTTSIQKELRKPNLTAVSPAIIVGGVSMKNRNFKCT